MNVWRASTTACMVKRVRTNQVVSHVSTPVRWDSFILQMDLVLVSTFSNSKSFHGVVLFIADGFNVHYISI